MVMNPMVESKFSSCCCCFGACFFLPQVLLERLSVHLRSRYFWGVSLGAQFVSFFWVGFVMIFGWLVGFVVMIFFLVLCFLFVSLPCLLAFFVGVSCSAPSPLAVKSPVGAIGRKELWIIPDPSSMVFFVQ